MTPPKSASERAEEYQRENSDVYGVEQVTASEAWLAGHAAGVAEAGELAVEAEWKEIRKWKPFLHWCRDWDFLLIDKGDPEFEACLCFKALAGDV